MRLGSDFFEVRIRWSKSVVRKKKLGLAARAPGYCGLILKHPIRFPTDVVTVLLVLDPW